MSERKDHLGPMGRALAGVNVLIGLALGAVVLVSLFGPQSVGSVALPMTQNATALLFFGLSSYFFLESAVLLGVSPPQQSRWRLLLNAAFLKMPLLLIAVVCAQAARHLSAGHSGGDLNGWLLGGTSLVAGITFFALLERDDPRTICAILDPGDHVADTAQTWRGWLGKTAGLFVTGMVYAFTLFFVVFLAFALSFIVAEVVRYDRRFGFEDLFRILTIVLELMVSIGGLWVLAFGFVYLLPGVADVREGTIPIPEDDDAFSESQFDGDERAYLTSSYSALLAYMRDRAYPDYFGWDVPLIAGGAIVGMTLIAPQIALDQEGERYAWGELAFVFGVLAAFLSLPLLRRLVSLVLPRYGEYRYLRTGGWGSGLAALHRQLAEDVLNGRLSPDRPFSPRLYLLRNMLAIRNWWFIVGFFVSGGLAILFWTLGS